jgi:hypothetical protein
MEERKTKEQRLDFKGEISITTNYIGQSIHFSCFFKNVNVFLIAGLSLKIC